jgi:hypothetical protein
MAKNREDEFIHAGGRNLLLLCLFSVIIATITTSVSVFIYYKSGNIYPDRSRPGYIAEGEKHDEADDNKENFSSDGEINAAALEEYKEQLKIVEERLNAAEDAFSSTPLSDETLGIGY